MFRAEDVAQLVERSPSMYKAWGSDPSTAYTRHWSAHMHTGIRSSSETWCRAQGQTLSQTSKQTTHAQYARVAVFHHGKFQVSLVYTEGTRLVRATQRDLLL